MYTAACAVNGSCDQGTKLLGSVGSANGLAAIEYIYRMKTEWCKDAEKGQGALSNGPMWIGMGAGLPTLSIERMWKYQLLPGAALNVDSLLSAGRLIVLLGKVVALRSQILAYPDNPLKSADCPAPARPRGRHN